MARMFLLLCVFVYLTDISVLAVRDNAVGIGLSSELKAEINDYVSRVVSTLTEAYENRITDLENELDLHKQRITALEAKELVYKSILANEPTRVEIVEDDSKDVNVNLTGNRNASHKATPERESIQGASGQSKDASRIRRNVDHEVAFFAYVTPYLDNLGVDQDIRFDNVVTNIGNAYNGRHGTFVAPVGGTYVFSVSLLGSHTYGHFMVNDNIIAQLDIQDDVHSSQTVIVNLQPGDDVSVQNALMGGVINGDGYSTFSGFLLY